MKKLIIPFLFLLIASNSVFAVKDSKSTTVYFQTDKHFLSDEAKRQLDQLITMAHNSHDFEIYIEGHTDNRGTLNYNDELSYNRSTAVKSYLLSQHISEKQIAMNYKGELAPVAPNNSSENMGSNRRVEVRLISYSFNNIADLEQALSRNEPYLKTIDPTIDNVLEGNKGVRVLIPKYAFRTATGDTVKEEVLFELIEALDIEDFISSGLETKSEDKLLETGGMVKLSAQTINGEEVSLGENSNILLSIPNANRKNDMEVFLSDSGSDWTATGRPITNQLTFEDIQPFPLLRSERTYYPIFRYNIDQPTPPSTPIKPRTPHQPKAESYFRQIPWYKFNKKKIRVQQERRYEAAIDRYDKRLLRYEKREEAYIKKMEAYEDLKNQHQDDLNNWSDRRDQAYLDFFKSPEYVKARAISARINKRYREEYAQEIIEWRAARKAYAEQWGISLDSLGANDNQDLNQYIFAVNTLNWINCDRFYEISPEEKQEVVLASSDVENEKVLIIFEDIRSMLAGTPRPKLNIFNLPNIPKKETAYIFAYKVVDQKPQICFMEMNGSNHYSLEFMESSFAEIKGILAQFNENG